MYFFFEMYYLGTYWNLFYFLRLDIEIVMEKHKQNLAKICRLCCKKITLNSSYSSAKTCFEVKDAIQTLFGHDISADSDSRHPPAICHKCSSKMNQAEKGDFEKAAIAVFEPHRQHGDSVGDADGIDSDSTCGLCKINWLTEHKFKMVKHKVFDIASSFGSQASQFGFHLISVKFSDPAVGSDGVFFVQYKPVNNRITVVKTVKIHSNLSWQLWIYKREISKTNQLLETLPVALNSDNIINFFQAISLAKICPGNDDFHDVIQYKLDEISDVLFIKSTVEDKEMNPLYQLKENLTTIRTNN